MKTLLLVLALNTYIFAQTTEKEWQAEAVKDFPQLAVQGSPLNKAFLAEVARLKREAPEFFTAMPGWPYHVASQCQEKLKPKGLIPGLDEVRAPQVAAKRTVNDVMKGLNNITFPRIDFQETPLAEVAQFLTKKSQEVDPQRLGVSVTLDATVLQSKSAGVCITLTLNNVPFIEVIKYVTTLADLRYTVSPDGVNFVSIAPLGGPKLITKFWNGMTPEWTKAFLEQRGVTFWPGGGVRFDARTKQLFVTNTEEQLDLVQRIIEVAQSLQKGRK